MTGRTPRAIVAGVGRKPPRADPGTERLTGYGALGLAFAMGDVLAFRRVAASSVGPAYTAVWHRDPRGRWTVFTDVDPRLSCPRYLGGGLTRAVETHARLEWTGPWSLAVTVPEHQLDWAIRLEPQPGTRAWSALARLLPRRAYRAPGPAVLIGAVAGWLLGTSPLQLQGRAPNGQWFAIRPTRLWAVTAGAAVVAGRDLGPLVHPHRPTHLDDIVLPDRGLFMAGEWLYERHDPARRGPTRSDPPGPDTPLRRGA